MCLQNQTSIAAVKAQLFVKLISFQHIGSVLLQKEFNNQVQFFTASIMEVLHKYFEGKSCFFTCPQICTNVNTQ